ncbi:NnrS family protein [Oceanisphaera arctica]|uniref:Heme-Cu protein NnrS n=1 Tax=Oceanisphaera arctica TaxID=641510 RepID=A0A2P5THU4_9GAMM|nr:NnrS family protein [Oceanisphaera arctica]PPL14098.1 heme-Cu protein NnrS [Oceanisphaera arctica]GHA08749.1 heme transporter CcmB [Oceanisphaera arctica]
MQILDAEKESKIWPLFRLGFRVFFMGGALFSCLAMFLWLLSLSGMAVLPGVGNPIWWHAHEMLFGFALAIVAGFVLTAMQNWTGIAGVRGWPLALVAGLWLLPRLLMPLRGELNPLVITLDLLWLPLVAGMLARPVLQVKQWRNLFFVPLFVLFTLLNALSYYAAFSGNWLLSERVFVTTVLALTGLIAVMGGRVIPFFTANATGTDKPVPHPWLEKLSLGTLWLGVLGWLLLPRTDGFNSALALILMVSALANLVRLARWNNKLARNIPLLWVLHLGYLFVPLGLLALAAALLNWGISISLASHWLTTGAIGIVILGMIARVSLGHSGRTLEIRRSVVIAFVLLILAALLRSLLPLLAPGMTNMAYHTSAMAWMLAFGLFNWVYWPILTRPRIDGRPG